MVGMATRSTNSYDEETVEGVVEGLGVDVESETSADYLILCPYHGNTRDPSMTVSKERGVFYCFNPSCNETGTLLELVMHVKQLDFLRATRFIEKYSTGKTNYSKRIGKLLSKKEMPTFDIDVIDRMHDDLWTSETAIDYMYGRGFTDETIRYFKFGYSERKHMIATPMHDFDGRAVGVIGRTIVDKRFKNSQKLPVSESLFNIHRARREGNEVILTESNFDTALVHQAGFPCVVASLGGNLSEQKIEQLDKTFDKIVIMTDYDKPQFNPDCARCRKAGSIVCRGHKPGFELGRKVEVALPHKKIYWAHTGGTDRLFGKDPGEMTADQIKTVMENKISKFQARTLSR